MCTAQHKEVCRDQRVALVEALHQDTTATGRTQDRGRTEGEGGKGEGREGEGREGEREGGRAAVVEALHEDTTATGRTPNRGRTEGERGKREGRGGGREGFPILVLLKVLLHILVHWNNYFYKIVLPVSGFFPVFLYYFDCVDPMLPRHILIFLILELGLTWPAVTTPTLPELCGAWPAVAPPILL